MKKIFTIAALATALVSAQAYAQAPRHQTVELNAGRKGGCAGL